jgi:peptidoglycan/xylan/chitin deacetylase (PgdA/CDA1 family)
LIILIWTGIVIVPAFFLYLGVPFIHRSYVKTILKNKAVKSRAFVLTFDDGPGDRLTPAIMDLLDKNNAKATFFLIGNNITGREEIVRQIKERGHEIGSHGYDHLNYWKVSPLRAIADMKRGWRTIDAALGRKRKKYIFRPPYGKLNFFGWLYLIACRVPIIYWTDDSGDSWSSKPTRKRFETLATNTNGTVCLAHDFNRSNKEKEDSLIESIRFALEKATEKGMQVMTISELLNSKN